MFYKLILIALANLRRDFVALTKSISFAYTSFMHIVTEPTVFDWDEGNMRKNLVKHGVTTEEAEEVFSSSSVLLLEDDAHSNDVEKRFAIYGKTSSERLLTVVFTIRGNKVRVISARDMHKKERSIYEQYS